MTNFAVFLNEPSFDDFYGEEWSLQLSKRSFGDTLQFISGGF